MKKILLNQKGVTLVETLAASLIIILLLFTVLGALMFGQGVIVGNDEKNNAVADAQEMVDTIMTAMSKGSSYMGDLVSGAKNLSTVSTVKADFINAGESDYAPRQYHISPVNAAGSKVADNSEIAYQIFVRVYYNQGQSYVDLTAYNKKGEVWP